ncbi:MAG: type II secretion system F family protein, partial [Phycisphaeraceae bacterium]|nr:type II secretion system F family protein [Phycisphaeraceae bacterium]
INKIKGQGLFPTSVREKKARRAQAGDTGKAVKKKKKATEISINIGGVSTKILTTFTRQLSTLQDAGLPLLRSLQILTDQQKPGLLRNTLEDITAEVEGGSSLSDAMAKHPKVFDELYTKMIAAGEVGGVLDVILQRLAEFMEKALRIKRKIIGAMIYPSVVISVAVAIVTGIMIFIVPKFQEIFQDFDTELPGMTKLLITMADWIGGAPEDQLIPGYVWIVAFPFIAFYGTKLLRKSKPGRIAVDVAKLRIPVIGPLLQYTAVARFTRTLGTLISAGVPILEAILITRDTIGNYVYENALQRVHDSIREGDTFVAPLRETKVVDPIVVNLIDVGEETGELDKMLIKIADNYDEEVDTKVSALISLLEPLMVVLLGGAVGFIVVALFLPLVALIQNTG